MSSVANEDIDDNIDEGYSGSEYYSNEDEENASAFGTRSKKSGEDTSYSSWMGQSELQRRNTIKAKKAARKQRLLQQKSTIVTQRKKKPVQTTKVMNFTFLPDRIMTLMHKDRLKNLEQTWEKYENGLSLAEFVQLMIDHIHTKDDDEKYELIYGSYKLFQEVDINGDGQMEWGEFMQYIIDAVQANAIKGGEDGDEKVQDQIARIEAKKFNRFQMAPRPIDKSNHMNVITQAIQCGETGKILAIERFGTEIKFYDEGLQMTKKKNIPLMKEGFVTGIAYDADKQLYGISCSDSYLHFYQQSKVRLEYLDNALIWTGEMKPRAKIKDRMHTVKKVYNDDKAVIKKVIDDIWDIYDDDESGSLDKDETRNFVQDCLRQIGSKNKFSYTNFETVFEELDQDDSGTIDKDEMVDFIKKIVSADGESKIALKSYMPKKGKMDPSDNIQTKIWYMPKQKLWLTAGKDFKLRHWAVFLNKPGHCLQTLELHTDKITDCVEVDNPVCIATCSLDRTIVLFDIEHREHLRTINQGHEKGIRHLRYQSVNGNQMISIGNETYANVWAPESLVSDVHIGTLRGHKKGIVDGAYLKLAPYFVTLDEQGQANFWDIQSFIVIQVIPSIQKSQAEGLVVLSNNVFWAFGRRFFQYDTFQADEDDIATSNEGIYPVSVQLNYYLLNIFVINKHQVRMYDIVSGRLQSLHTNLFHEENVKSEITCFKIDKRHRKAYISNNQGQVIVINCQNGVMMKNCTQHIEDAKNIKNMEKDRSHESITSLGSSQFDQGEDESDESIGSDLSDGLMDSAGAVVKKEKVKGGPEINDLLLIWEDLHDDKELIMMLCADSKYYYIYDERDPEDSQMLRKIGGGHMEEITILEYSFHLSLVATGCVNGEIAIYDFEMSKCEALLMGHTGDITALEFMDPYPLLISAAMDATVCIWGVRPCPQKILYVCVKRYQNISWKHEKDKPSIVTRLMVWNMEGKGIKKYRRLKGNQLPATSFRDFEQNFAFSFRDLDSIFDEEFPQPKHTKINYPEAFKMEKVLNGKIYKELLEDEKSKTFVTQKQSVGEDYNEKIHEVKERNYLVVGDEFGFIKLWDFTELYRQIGVEKVKRFVDLRLAFNPYRQETVDCSLVTAGHRTSYKLKPPTMPSLIDPGMTGVLIREAQAHNDVIKNLSKMKLDDFDAVVTGAKDNRVRIWSLSFDLLGNINGKTDMDDPKWKLPSSQRVINRENDLKQIEELMDDIKMGLKNQRLRLIVDANRQIQKVEEKVKTRANWFKLQEAREQKAKELQAEQEKAARLVRLKHERGEMVKKKILRVANEVEMELSLLSNVHVPKIPDSGYTADLSEALTVQQQELTVGLAQQIKTEQELLIEQQDLGLTKKGTKLKHTQSILSKTSNTNVAKLAQTRQRSLIKQGSIASIPATKKPSERKLDIQPFKSTNVTQRNLSPDESGETTHHTHAKTGVSKRSLSQVQNYSDMQSQHFHDSIVEKDLISQRSRAPKIRSFMESLRKKDRFGQQPESFSALANYARHQQFGNRQFSIADSEIQKIAELEGNGLINDASQATIKSSIEQYQIRRKSKLGKYMGIMDSNNQIKSSQVDLMSAVNLAPAYQQSRNHQALMNDYTGDSFRLNQHKQVRIKGLDISLPGASQDGGGQQRILKRNPLALKFQTIQQESDRFKSMDRNQKSPQNSSQQGFGLPQIKHSVTKGSVSFGATQTMRGAKSALATSPKAQMSSNTVRNSNSILSARDSKAHKDFETVKSKYGGSNSVLVEESKALKERLEQQREMITKLKKQKLKTMPGGL